MNQSLVLNPQKQLARRYNSCAGKTDSTFFRGVADYTKYILETPRLFCFIVALLNSQKEADYKRFYELDKSFRREISSVGKKLFGIIRQQKFQSVRAKLHAQSYDFIERKEEDSDQYDPLIEYPPLDRYDNLFHILRILNEDGHSRVVGKFLPLRKKDDYILSRAIEGCPSYQKIEFEIKCIEEKRENSIWGSWNYLLRVYTTIHRKDEYASNLIENDTFYLQRINFSLWVEEMEVILGKRSPEEYTFGQKQFNRENYNVHLDRIHNYLTGCLEDKIAQIENINYNDNNEKKSWEKFWDLQQAIRGVYEGQPRIKLLRIESQALLIKNRSREIIEPLLNRLRDEGCFQQWHFQEGIYVLSGVSVICLLQTYQETEKIYHRFADTYQEREKQNYKDKKKTLVYKDKLGNYYYNGKKIKIPKETLYYNIFDILYLYHDQEGFISYSDIDKELHNRKIELKEIENHGTRNRRVNNAIVNKNQGFFRNAKINGKKILNKTLNGEKLIDVRRGKGIILNNPEM